MSPYSGKLIVVEGIDGSGKSTQIRLLERWLLSRGYAVFFTEWNSSELVRETTKMGKKKDLLTPTTFSLLHATDFADRHQDIIVPPLKAGMVVLADRYIYTAFARDAVRGVDKGWVRDLYSFAVKPDLCFYFKVPLDVAVRRIAGGRGKIKYHEAGMDLNSPTTSPSRSGSSRAASSKNTTGSRRNSISRSWTLRARSRTSRTTSDSWPCRS